MWISGSEHKSAASGIHSIGQIRAKKISPSIFLGRQAGDCLPEAASLSDDDMRPSDGTGNLAAGV